MLYAEYLMSRYRICCIVFDGYRQCPSTKDHEHQRRVCKTCADVHITGSMHIHHDQEMLLTNERNEAQFISLLARYLEADGHIVHIDIGDADTLIVACALQFANEERETAEEADYTYILVLLIYHWKQGMADIYFHPKPTKPVISCTKMLL